MTSPRHATRTLFVSTYGGAPRDVEGHSAAYDQLRADRNVGWVVRVNPYESSIVATIGAPSISEDIAIDRAEAYVASIAPVSAAA
jgi:hypothetical protein